MDKMLESEILNLIAKTKTIIISATDEQGFPIIKGVTKLGNDGYNALYFISSPSSEFSLMYKTNPKASAYLFFDDPTIPYPSPDEKYYGLSLVGNIEEENNPDIKKRFWQEGWDEFYPNGINDKNYYLLKVVAKKGKYFRGVSGDMLSTSFSAEK